MQAWSPASQQDGDGKVCELDLRESKNDTALPSTDAGWSTRNVRYSVGNLARGACPTRDGRHDKQAFSSEIRDLSANSHSA
jgi:hypothetical protein